MQNLVEKIAQRFAVGLKSGQKVRCGDYLFVRPAHVMTHDNTGAVMMKFAGIGATGMADPCQPVFALDHNIQDKSEKNMEKYRNIETFAGRMGVDFYPAGRGIGHQIICEEGYAWPGTVVVASDSHSNMYGGLGCLGTPVVRTDAAAIWATGQTWWQIPPVAKVTLTGELQKGVTGKDAIITLCGVFNNNEVLNHAVEFAGDGLAHLLLDDRLTIANMTTEWGALTGFFPVDSVTIEWLRARADAVLASGGSEPHPRLNHDRIDSLEKEPLSADEDAVYVKELSLDLATVRQHISGPDYVKTVRSVADVEREHIPVNKAYLVSCVNSRAADIAQAAEVIRSRKVADAVQFYVAAASSEVQTESEERGDWWALVNAGAVPLPPGCGPCIGLGVGLLEDGEVGISATNRNFKGRMGSRDAQAYLASPAVVAASAVNGFISGVGDYGSGEPLTSITTAEMKKKPPGDIQMLKGFPATVEGELIFCHQDNLNTDGIFPGKYTYIDDFSPEQQAEVAMENYDPAFVEIVRDGDILVGGFSFGSGSSREQAATALKYAGIRLVIAGSFSQTYARNAINNGFLVLKCPELAQDLKASFGEAKLTMRTVIVAQIDFGKAVIRTAEKDYPVDPVGATAQELIIAGGLENWVQEKLERGI